jgi:FMN-dependent NADH-azoreductase
LRDWLNQAGVTAVDEIRFQPTMLSESPAEDLKKARPRIPEFRIMG